MAFSISRDNRKHVVQAEHVFCIIVNIFNFGRIHSENVGIRVHKAHNFLYMYIYIYIYIANMHRTQIEKCIVAETGGYSGLRPLLQKHVLPYDSNNMMLLRIPLYFLDERFLISTESYILKVVYSTTRHVSSCFSMLTLTDGLFKLTYTTSHTTFSINLGIRLCNLYSYINAR